MIFNRTILSGCLLIAFGWAPANTLFAEDNVSVSKRIDTLLENRYRSEGIFAGQLTDDLTFLRRVSLDLKGRIPTLEEIESFQKDPDRESLIDDLIDSESFDEFLSEAWTTWLIGYSYAFQTDREMFRIWLRKQISNDVSFKSIVSQILVAEGSVAINGPANFLARHYDQPVTAVCRSFLGVRIECAQCHDHPFDRWTQDDFESMRRFFQPLRRQQRNGVVVLSDVAVRGDQNNGPQFLTGAKPRTGRYRQELALYLTNCKPFARNFVNRCWYFLLGQGIVDPPDDFNQENPAVARDLLELLADHARKNDFNVKEMFRTICKTDAYQRTALASTDKSKSNRLFAHQTIKPLLPTQYIDSLLVAVDRPLDGAQRRNLVAAKTNVRALNEDFQRTWEYRETVQQLMQNMTFQFLQRDLGSTDEIFLRLLTRKPTSEEREICNDQEVKDVLFALALGNEFCFNH